MSSIQNDTIIVSLFTNEDLLMDIAVYYETKNEIVVFKNLGNGFLDTLKKFPIGEKLLTKSNLI